MCDSALLQMVGCAMDSEADIRRHKGAVVLLDNTIMGPLLPPYWPVADLGFWSDAYTDRLSDA
eukprot:10383894-Prorocentrum_lima.AAC.1